MLLVPHDDLGSLRFTTSRLAGDDDASVFPCPLHGLVGGLGDGEDVWHAFVAEGHELAARGVDPAFWMRAGNSDAAQLMHT